MKTDDSQKEKETLQNGGNPFFEMKATLQSFIKNKKWESLKEASRNMISLYPEMEFGWFALAMAYSRTGDHKSASTNYKKAIYLNPDFTSAYYQLGITYFRTGDYVEAIGFFKLAMGKGMQSHYLYYNLGNAYYKSLDFERAIKNYLKCLSITPSFTPAAYGMFKIYFKEENYKFAVNTLKPVISDTNLPSYLLSKARLLYENEKETSYFNLRQAQKLLNSAIDLDDKFALAYYERAYVKARLGDSKGFSHDKAMAFQLNPELRKGHSVSIYSSFYL